jgi:hypothetical protein
VKKLAFLCLLAVGCATTPPARAPRTASVSGGSQVELVGRAQPSEVDAFGARLGEHALAGRDACCAALLEDSPDLALDLLRRALRAGDAGLARTLGALSGPSVAAQAKAPERHRAAWTGLAAAEAALAARDLDLARARARESRATLAELGDTLGVEDADLVLLLSGEEPAARPALVRSAAEARVALELAGRAGRAGDPVAAAANLGLALRFARGTRDLALATEVESARASLGVSLPPAELGDWLRSVARLALERKRPLVALRCALDAGNAGEPGAARALVASAHLASGQAAVALEAALVLARDARDQGDAALEATADGIAGESLLALERPGDAAGCFERAAALARGAGDADGWARRSLNLARTQLRRGETADARSLLDSLERSLGSHGRLAARVALARACALASADEFAASRAALDRALGAAAACGDYETVEQSLALRRRLGNLGT